MNNRSMKSRIFPVIAFVLMIFQAHAQSFGKISGNPGFTQTPKKVSAKHSRAEGKYLLEDGFESYDDFSIDFQPWTLHDLDGMITWGLDGIQFPNQFSPKSFIVFTPESTVPPFNHPEIAPHSGLKIAACFAANGAANNDWLISPRLRAGSNTSVSFFVKSFTSQYGLERYRVAVSTTGTDPGDFTYISGSSYLLAPVVWTQKNYDLNAYNGKNIYIGIQCVSNNAFVFMVDDFVFTTTAVNSDTLSGMVTDALDGNPLQGAVVTVAGLKDTTDVNGNYFIAGIPVGALNADFYAEATTGTAPLTVQFYDHSTENTHSVTCSKSGYITYVNEMVAIPGNGNLQMNISLSPELAAGNLRFVLNWGALPPDLDSHLATPVIEGTPHHIYWGNRGYANSVPWARLDNDVTTGFGPETVTIYQVREGKYFYYIHNYSGTQSLPSSGAVVQVYAEEGLIHTIRIPETGEGNYWNVCEVNGPEGEINIRNNLQLHPPDLNFRDADTKPNTSEILAGRSIMFWLWDFGDGNTSVSQHPSHTYHNQGIYTVSLTISNGNEEDSETKSAFVQVGPQGIDELLSGDAVQIYPNPARNIVYIESQIPVTETTVTNITGAVVARFSGNTTSFSIETGSLKSGIYFIAFNTSRGLMVRKLAIR